MPETEVRNTIPGHFMVTMLYQENGGLQRPINLLATSTDLAYSLEDIEKVIKEVLQSIETDAAENQHLIFWEAKPLLANSKQADFKPIAQMA